VGGSIGGGGVVGSAAKKTRKLKQIIKRRGSEEKKAGEGRTGSQNERQAEPPSGADWKRSRGPAQVEVSASVGVRPSADSHSASAVSF
jgi:hypothetical protein